MIFLHPADIFHASVPISAQCPLTPKGVPSVHPSKTFVSSRLGVEDGPVVQPPVLRVDVQYPLPGDKDPFGRDDDEGEDEPLQAAPHVHAREDAADLGQQIQVEVLQHGGEEQEHRVVLHGREGKVGPAEVIVLHVEVPLAPAPLVVLVYDLLFGTLMVVGQYGSVHVFHAGQELLPLLRSPLGALDHEPQVPVGEEVGEFERGDFHLLAVHHCGPPFPALPIHPPALGAAAGAEVERLRPQGKLLDKFLDERAAVGAEHAHVQPMGLNVVQHACQLLHLLELDVRVALPVLHAYQQRAGSHHAWEIAALLLIGIQRVALLGGDELVVEVDVNVLPLLQEAKMQRHVEQKGVEPHGGVMRIDAGRPARVGNARGAQLLQPAGDGVGAGYPRLGRGGQVLVQDGGDVLYMVATAEIDAEQREDDVAVPVAIARTADAEAAVQQPVQSRALEFVHHIKNSAVGDDIVVFYCYLCHAM